MQQGDQAFAIGMQDAEIARAAEALGQHMLQHQPEELRTGHGTQFHLPGLCILVPEAHLATAHGDDILLRDDAPVEVAPEVDERLVAAAHALAIDDPAHRVAHWKG